MSSEKFSVPGCRNTTVQEVFQEDGLQILKVEVEAGGEIPLHSHNCAATMVIIEGSARAMGKDGRIVRAGDVVIKSPNEPHGFTNIEGLFSFVSISDEKGIKHADAWDIRYLQHVG